MASGYVNSKVNKIDFLTGEYKGTTLPTDYYPKNDGALGKWKTEYLMEGTEIDRFGDVTGKYFSPLDTPDYMRALPPNANKSLYSSYRVVKPFPVRSSTIAPAFGQMGFGKQYLSPVSAEILLKRGIIVPRK